VRETLKVNLFYFLHRQQRCRKYSFTWCQIVKWCGQQKALFYFENIIDSRLTNRRWLQVGKFGQAYCYHCIRRRSLVFFCEKCRGFFTSTLTSIYLDLTRHLPRPYPDSDKANVIPISLLISSRTDFEDNFWTNTQLHCLNFAGQKLPTFPYQLVCWIKLLCFCSPFWLSCKLRHLLVLFDLKIN